jgi:hypothetical protein
MDVLPLFISLPVGTRLNENIYSGLGAPNSMPVDENRKFEVPRDQTRKRLGPGSQVGSGLDQEES